MVRRFSRREAIGLGMFAGASLALPASFTGSHNGTKLWAKEATKSGRFFGYRPFTQPLYFPPVAAGQDHGFFEEQGQISPQDVWARGPQQPNGVPEDVNHGIAPEFGHCDDWNAITPGRSHEKEFQLHIEETTQRFVPGGPDTPVFTYRDGQTPQGEGRTPGPTIVVDYQAPVVVRNFNHLTRGRSGENIVNTTNHDHETSMHLHGVHAPAHSDGYPDFYTLAGEGRDYFYPNTAPRETDMSKGPHGFASACEGPFDTTWIPSTLWYHDHAMDVTGFNVARGLAGFYLVRSRREAQLSEIGRIPALLDAEGNLNTDGLGGPLDFGLALGDQIFTDDGAIYYDFLDHNGRLGNVPTVNGVVQPFHKLERRKYRMRILNASNSRYMEIRLSNRQKMHIIGTDSWLLPEAVEVRRFNLAPGQRHDVIIDFRGAPDDVFLQNILHQEDGRKGKEIDPSKRITLMKFEVSGPNHNELGLRDRDLIRGYKGQFDPALIGDQEGEFAFIPREIVHTKRKFQFERSNGAWVVNNQLYNPRRADAVPKLGLGAEQWTIENSSGGWWHPIHAHLEGFQVRSLNGGRIRRERRFNCDTFNLEGGNKAKILLKFRSFTGPFVFHCHAIEHEDMRMMATHDPTPIDGTSGAIDAAPPMDGETMIASEQSGVVPDCIDLEHDKRLYFDEVGNIERLEGRGVGFPECEFDMSRRGNRG
ncbi:MAG: multicopper oxidase family protein [Hyphomicrobiaceae bacterium]